MDRLSPAYLLALSAIRRGVENFVRIVAEKDIPVKYVSADKVTAGSSTVFDTQKTAIEISAPDDIDKVDSIVGRAIAEGVHIVLSHQTHTEESLAVFPAIKHIFTYPQHFVTDDIRQEMTRLRVTDKEFAYDFTRVLLVLEDRRCDDWMYKRAPGYRPYYEEMYRELWQSEEIEFALQLPETAEPTLDNYRFHVTNIGHPALKVETLPGLADIARMFDLPNVARFAQNVRVWHTYQNGFVHNIATQEIYYEDRVLPEMMVVARQTVLMMYQNSLTPPEQPKPEPQPAPSQEKPEEPKTPTSFASAEELETFLKDDDEKDEIEPLPLADPDEHLTLPQRMIKGLQKALDDDLYHITKKLGLDTETNQSIQALESADADLREVGNGMNHPTGEPLNKIPCVIYRRLTNQLLASDSFPFSKTFKGDMRIDADSAGALIDGTHMGNILAHRIQVLADEHKLIITRQKKGRIDKRMLSGLGYDNDAVFYESLIERKDPIILHFSVDASGSMSGKKWRKSMTVAVALARAAHKIRTLDVTISLRSSDNFGNAAVAMIFDSRCDSFDHVRHFFPYLSIAGSTPEGLAFEAIREDILGFDPHARKFFVNISDGAPAFSTNRGGKHFAYGGESAYRHTALQMRDFREAGIHILSYFVDDAYPNEAYVKAFRQMYGRDAEFIDVEKVTQIARTLNKMFIKEAGET